MDLLLHYNTKEILLLSYLFVINIISFILFAIDKRRAKRKEWRISESALLISSFIGGSTGALISMVIFKHKLSKKRFYILVPIFIVFNKLITIWIFSMVK